MNWCFLRYLTSRIEGEASEEFENRRAMLKLLFHYFNRQHLLVTSRRVAYALHQAQPSASLYNVQCTMLIGELSVLRVYV